jgi:oligopeptide/dipeptide ABC transporter ATP-binding protein
MTPLLAVRDLATSFFTEDGTTRAVDGVSFDVGAGETLGLVGESGCGKSVTALSIMRLLPPRLGRTVRGSVAFEGRDLLGLDESEMRAIRGNRIAMIFQEPMTSLNPVLTIGHQIAESVRIHEGASPAEARARAVSMLNLVRIPDGERRLDDYPHQFSGGMRQRVMIAMALACNPRLLIADEPTTALDVTIQAQILELLKALVREHRTALVMITHDLGVVAGMCERVNVMYGGMFMETGSAEAIFGSPRHPYTLGLLQSVPRLDAARKARLHPIEGAPRDMLTPPQACPFAPRCRYEVEQSRQAVPPLVEVEPGHFVACFNPVPADEWRRSREQAVA